MPTKFAIVKDREWLYIGGDYEEIKQPIDSFAALGEVARARGLTQLWLLPGSDVFRDVQQRPESYFAERAAWQVRPRGPKLNNLISVWSLYAPDRIQIIAPGIAHNTRGRAQWPLDEVADEDVLADSVRVLKTVLGGFPTIPIKTGRELLQRTTPRRNLNFVDADFAPFLNQRESGIEYKRQLTKAERGKKWLHVIDKRRAYLASYGAHFGTGELTHRSGPIEFDKTVCGLWLVTLRGKEPKCFPCSDQFRLNSPQWLYTPMLEVAGELGLSVEVHEAFVFNGRARVFEGFYKTLREGIKRIEQSTTLKPQLKPITIGCLKSIVHQFYAWLAHPSERRHNLFRPDWRGMLVAHSKANIIRNIARGYGLGLRAPIGVRVDSLMYLSNEADAGKAVPGYFLNSETGQYRLKYSIELRRALPLLESAQSIQRIDDQLNSIVKGH